jgi:hypothetical protein
MEYGVERLGVSKRPASWRSAMGCILNRVGAVAFRVMNGDLVKVKSGAYARDVILYGGCSSRRFFCVGFEG